MRINDRGHAVYGLPHIHDERRSCIMQMNIADLLCMPGVDEIDIEFPRCRDIEPPFEFD
jgi:hypothetical protein